MIPDAEEVQVSPFKSKRGVRRIFSAFSYSLDGIRSAWRNEHAFRQEVLLTLAMTTIACGLPVSPLERLLLIGVFALVLILELLNSAIEAVVDQCFTGS